MSWGYIAGAAISVVGGMVAKNNGPSAPGVAQYTPVDPQAEQNRAIAGNLANLPNIEELLSKADRYTQGQALALMEQAIPGYSRLSQSLMSRAQTQADHPYDVPQDVQDNLTRISAERGISRGTRGQTNQYSLLRDLGINEVQFGQDQLKSSLGALTTLTGIAPRVSPTSPLSMFLTPAQAISTTTNNNTTQQAITQGGLNANTAANNFANQAQWDAIMKAAGIAVSGIDWTGRRTGDGSSGGGSGSGSGSGGPTSGGGVSY